MVRKEKLIKEFQEKLYREKSKAVKKNKTHLNNQYKKEFIRILDFEEKLDEPKSRLAVFKKLRYFFATLGGLCFMGTFLFSSVNVQFLLLIPIAIFLAAVALKLLFSFFKK